MKSVFLEHTKISLPIIETKATAYNVSLAGEIYDDEGYVAEGFRKVEYRTMDIDKIQLLGILPKHPYANVQELLYFEPDSDLLLALTNEVVDVADIIQLVKSGQFRIAGLPYPRLWKDQELVTAARIFYERHESDFPTVVAQAKQTVLSLMSSFPLDNRTQAEIKTKMAGLPLSLSSNRPSKYIHTREGSGINISLQEVVIALFELTHVLGIEPDGDSYTTFVYDVVGHEYGHAFDTSLTPDGVQEPIHISGNSLFPLHYPVAFVHTYGRIAQTHKAERFAQGIAQRTVQTAGLNPQLVDDLNRMYISKGFPDLVRIISPLRVSQLFNGLRIFGDQDVDEKYLPIAHQFGPLLEGLVIAQLFPVSAMECDHLIQRAYSSPLLP